ncbi:MAG: GIY-YIG nuclease family protein [Flavobacterium sp.]|nr:GIY-YIG nuclease family protein [Flavobacterium sp.]
MYYVYIMANKNNTVLYIGFTNDIIRRTKEHKDRINKGFTYRYNVDKLVYYEVFGYINDAILREKRLKKWNRDWKIQLIEKATPIGMTYH